MSGKDKQLSDAEWQHEFERGQEYEKNFQPFNQPMCGPFESDEHFQEREDAFQAGRRSIRNDPNQ